MSDVNHLASEREDSRTEEVFVFPASFAQERLWFLDQLIPGSPVYNIAHAVSLKGPVDPRVLERSLTEIVARHETLRTTFELMDDAPVQIVSPELHVALPVVDLSEVAPLQRQAEVSRLAREEARQPFDTKAGPLLRTTLLELDAEEFVGLLTMHHIVSDAWSMEVMTRELLTVYEAFSRGERSPLPELPIQYVDFAVWQREWLQGETLDEQLLYWKEKLEGVPTRLELPADRPRPAVQTFRGSERSFALTETLSEKLRMLSQQEGVTLFMTLLAAFKALLNRYTTQEDILIGAPIANRNRIEIEGLIGFFVNILALRTDMSGDPTFRDLLQRVEQVVVDAHAHQDLPAEKLLEELPIKRETDRMPLAQVAFALQHAPRASAKVTGLTVSPIRIETGTAVTDLTLFVREGAEQLVAHFEYNTDLFDASTIDGMLENFKSLLETVVADPERHISALPPFFQTREADTRSLESAYEYSNLTYNQLLIWVGQKLHPEVPTYNVAATLTIRGDVNRDHFQKVFQALVDSTDTFRTVVDEVNGLPQQRVLQNFPYSVEYADFSQAAGPDVDAEAWMKERCRVPFNLSKCLFDCVLIKIADQKYVWYLNQHHLFTDAWSVWLNFSRGVDLYEQGKSDTAVTYPSFQEYLDVEHHRRGSAGYKRAQAYWQAKTAEPLEPLTFYGNRGPREPGRGHRVRVELGAAPSEELKFLATQEKSSAPTRDASFFTLFATLLLTYLYRMTGSRRLSLGAMFHNRASRFKQTAGLFLEMIALRVTIEPRDTFSSLFEKVSAELRQSMRHAQFSIRNSTHDKAYEVVLNYINRSNEEHRNWHGARLEAGWIHTGYTDNTLGLQVVDFGASGEFTLEFDFHAAVFDETMSQTAIRHFLQVVKAYRANPQESLCNVGLLSDDEKRRILLEFNDTGAVFPRDESLMDLFEAQVRRTPDGIAAVCAERSATYAELNRKSNQLAHQLRSMGVGPDVLVGICMDRSLELLVGIMGILKAGGAYIPLDTKYPMDRLTFILNDARARVLIIREGLLDEDRLTQFILPDSCPLRTLRVGEDWAVVDGERDDNPIRCVPSASLSYMIYTSGSTGSPKGAMVEHRGMLNHLFIKITDLEITESDVVAQTASQCFDISVWQFLAALLVGGRVHIYPDAIAFDPLRLPRETQHDGITIFETVPSLFKTMLREEAFAGNPCAMRWVIVTGEALPPESCREWLELHPKIPLLNAYGPTECSDDVTHHVIADPPADPCTSVPIGHALANLQIYITDRDLQPLPIGIAGELCVGGAGVGRGYCNDPAQTARVFVPDCFAVNAGKRLYRTGDVTRCRPDGTIEFLGRMDTQVKVRGFRIELGEVEALLTQHPSVTEAVVLADEPQDEDGTPNPALARLIGYVRADRESVPTAGELHRFLRQRLPEYMVPQAFVFLYELPLTANGKVDRQGLPEPEGAGHLVGAGFVPPRTPTEEIIGGIWSETLKLQEVGVYDDFFELGGHSLLATQVVSRINQAFDVELPLLDLFRSPTIAKLAEIIEAGDSTGEGTAAPPLVPVGREGDLALSFAQQRLWFVDQLEPGNTGWNMPSAVRLKGQLDVGALRRSFNEIVRRHESLRTSFGIRGEEPVQLIAGQLELGVPVVDLRGVGEEGREEEARRMARLESQTRFDLARGPLVRALLVQLGEAEHVSVFVMHHIISDGWSQGVLLRELMSLYGSFSAGRPSPLPNLPIQYADFAHWQREWLRGEVLERELSYWREELEGAPPLLDLPTDRPRPAVQSFRGALESVILSKETTEKLRALSRGEGVTLFMTLLAALNILLSRLSGQEDVVVGAAIAGRNRAETEGLIGFFINALALRTRLEGNPSFVELLGRVRKACLGAYAHQDLPFEKIVEEIQPQRGLGYNPLFRVLFDMVNIETEIELPGLQAEPVTSAERAAKFDLTLYAPERDGTVKLSMAYSTDLFDGSRIATMLRQLQFLLEQVVERPEEQIDSYSLVDGETKELLPDPTVPLGNHWVGAAHTLFSEQARKHPERLAVIDPRDSWTYGELDGRTNQLAQYLISAGIRKGDVVAIYGHHSASLVWALMGVLKAGAVFMVLDPGYPASRNISYLSLARPRGWLAVAAAGDVAEELKTQVATIPCRLTLPGLAAAVAQDFLADHSSAAPSVEVGPDDLAYVAFTSGSTGEPKGVLGRHGPVTHFFPFQQEKYGLNEKDRFILIAGLAHILVHREVFTSLSMGAQLYAPPEEDVRSPERIVEWIEKEEITVLHATPGRGQMLHDIGRGGLQSLRLVVLSSDELRWPNVRNSRRWAPNAMVVGRYGATETQFAVADLIVSRQGEMPPGTEQSEESVPLGQGVRGVQYLVLNGGGKLAGLGELGWLYVRSLHLAKGYLGDEALTQERFIKNPFTNQVEDRLYKTLDRARYRLDGNIQFVGRGENTVNIRAYRVELGDVEAALRRHTAVKGVTVVARQFGDFNNPDDLRLVAYLVLESGRSVLEVRQFLRQQLPEYMVPSYFETIDSLPLTPIGKVDRAALPEPSLVSGLEEDVVGPQTETEKVLVEIWNEVLRLDRVGIHDNFFDLGGHSLLATRMMSRVRERFDVEIPLKTLFEASTLAELARNIDAALVKPSEQRDQADFSSLVVIHSSGSRSPFFCVHPVQGTVISYRRLSRHLGADQPFYGLQAQALNEAPPLYRDIAVIAAHYIEKIREIQARGPYVLGGWSAGGVIAFEMAQQLHSQGEQVPLLALFDTYAPNAVGPDEVSPMVKILADLDRSNSIGGTTPLSLRERIASVLKESDSLAAEDMLNQVLVISMIRDAISNYSPKPYEGQAVLFKAAAAPEAVDSNHGWAAFVRGELTLKTTPGTHFTLLEEPNVGTIARELSVFLNKE